jgi:DNA polymerase-3 subunit delta'
MNTDNTDQLHWPLLGNSPVKRLLQSAVSHQKVAQAYLFVGPAHVGKFSAASQLANSLICQSKDERRPCNHCAACDQFAKGLHPDVDIIAPNENLTISISEIRSLQHKTSLRSFLTEYKIAIIDEAGSMTEESANALLKTLEEPTPKTVFILTAETKESLPQTIVSRCQLVQFNLTQDYQIENWLISRGMDKKKANTIARFANGRPGIAASLIDSQQPMQDYQESVQSLVRILNGSIYDRLALTSAMTREQPGRKTNNDIETALDSWISYYRDSLYILHNMQPLVSRPSVKDTKDTAKLPSPAKICSMIERIFRTKQLIRQNANPRLVMENLILSF